MTDEQRVKEVWPDAESQFSGFNWGIISRQKMEVLGVGNSEAEAWHDAASRLPKVENRLCDECEGNGKVLAMCGECNGTGYAIDPPAKEGEPVPDDCLDITDDGKVIIAPRPAAPPVAEPAPQTFKEWWMSKESPSSEGIHSLIGASYEAVHDNLKNWLESAWNAAKASSPALSVREEIDRDDAIIQDTVNRDAFFLDWRLASLAAKKGHRGLMTTTAGDFVVLTDRQELELRQAASAVASSSPAVAGRESEMEK